MNYKELYRLFIESLDRSKKDLAYQYISNELQKFSNDLTMVSFKANTRNDIIDAVYCDKYNNNKVELRIALSWTQAVIQVNQGFPMNIEVQP